MGMLNQGNRGHHGFALPEPVKMFFRITILVFCFVVSVIAAYRLMAAETGHKTVFLFPILFLIFLIAEICTRRRKFRVGARKRGDGQKKE